VIATAIAVVSSAPIAIAVVLAAALAMCGWRGGAWRRGSLAGMLAGLPPLVMPHVVAVLGHRVHCAQCDAGPTLGCLLACFATAGVVGTAVGIYASRDGAPRRFALAAIATAALVGMLGCTTTGMIGAAGVVIGLVAGGVTGWTLVLQRAR
jgi:hypothetical protein